MHDECSQQLQRRVTLSYTLDPFWNHYIQNKFLDHFHNGFCLLVYAYLFHITRCVEEIILRVCSGEQWQSKSDKNAGWVEYRGTFFTTSCARFSDSKIALKIRFLLAFLLLNAFYYCCDVTYWTCARNVCTTIFFLSSRKIALFLFTQEVFWKQ